MDNHPLSQLARELTYKYFGNDLEVGKIVRHPSGKLVKIISGQFLGSYGRLSNHWTWQEVLEFGTLGPEEHGYGWRVNGVEDD